MSSDIITPIHVPVATAVQITGESRTALYLAIAKGELSAFKEGPRTLLSYQELVKRCALRQPVKLKQKPHLQAARDEARRKKQQRKSKTHKR